MVQYCCVPLCNGRGGPHFPKDVEKEKWKAVIKKGVPGNKNKIWEPSPYDIVCHRHFRPEDYKETLLGERRRLKKGIVPSIFTEREQPKTEQNLQKEEQKTQRQKRATQRAEKRQLEPNIEDIAQDIEVVSDEPAVKLCKTEDTNSSIGVQCSLLTERSAAFTIDNLQNNDKAVKYYTGFDDYTQFMTFFTSWDQQRTI